MGKSVKPSYERRRRYRTCDRPPTRQARRNGCGAGMRAARKASQNHRLPSKKPASRSAAGFVHGHHRGERHACAEVTGCRHPPLRTSGGVACRASGRRVVCVHLLPQEMSAGRNLITLFSSVNNLSQSFSPHPSGTSWRHPAMAATPRFLHPCKDCMRAAHGFPASKHWRGSQRFQRLR